MELKIASMENMKKVVEKCLDDLMKKSDLTPAETKTALDGFKLYDELCCRIEDCKNVEEQPERGYSGNAMPHKYHITSYGLPEMARSERNYSRMNGYSNGEHGLYQSNNYPMSMNDTRSYCDDPYYYGPEHSERRGYSRHSIGDRVVSMVEDMMDSAKSDYERQELQKYIRTIRAMSMVE